MGTLFLVATPIGNLEDMSPRAVRILKEVKLIAAEDTRHTRQLLSYFEIHTPLTSYHEHNKVTRLDAILAALSMGDVALVSDAGMPAINDPGYELVRAVIDAQHVVSPVPGPSAPIAALAVSGLPTDSFLYLGYMPRKTSERRVLFEKIGILPYTLIFLESPHRVLDTLNDLLTLIGDREMAAARELTKIYEQVVRGPISQVIAHFTKNEARGEFVLIFSGSSQKYGSEKWSIEALKSAIYSAGNQNRSAKDLAAELSDQSGWSRRDVYKAILDQK